MKSIGLIKKRNRIGFYFTLPVLFFLITFIILPLVTNVRLSFTDMRGTFVGLEHFEKILTSSTFWSSFLITCVYVVASLVFQIGIGVAIGVLLNMGLRFKGVLRGIVLIPWVVPGAVAATTWAWMYHGDFGIVTRFLQIFFPGMVGPLIQPNIVIPALVFVNVWKMFPFVAVMVLAGLQSIDKTLYEAADVDGANKLAEFIHITLPGLKNVLLSVLLLLTIWNFNSITLVYTMTGGGPADLSLILPILIHRTAFAFFRTNEAAAMSLLMFVLLFVIIGIYIRVFSSRTSD